MNTKTSLAVALFIAHTVLTAIAVAQPADTLVVRYLAAVKEDVYSKDDYYYQLLKLSLDKTVGSFGPYRLSPGAESQTSMDALKQMMAGQGIDIVHTNTQKSREKVLTPIRIPLDKGLIGARLVMVNEKDKSIFKQAKNAEDLRRMKFAQGEFWPDTEILKHNGLQLKTAKEYVPLLEMLGRREVDGFPRAVFEIYDEVAQYKDKNLSVAEGIYIYYPSAIYFFVRKDPHGARIAKRVHAGLKAAIDDGSFDALFNKAMKPHLDKARLFDRVPVVLKNPLLPDETPLQESALWYLKLQ
jgi:hypothetical protein